MRLPGFPAAMSPSQPRSQRVLPQRSVRCRAGVGPVRGRDRGRRTTAILHADRNASAFANGANADTNVMGLPRHLVWVVGAAAGETWHQAAALTWQPDTGKQTTSGIGVAEKNNNFGGNDQKERYLA